MRHDIYLHYPPAGSESEVLKLLRRIDQRTLKMNDTLDTVLETVTDQTGKIASLKALVIGLADQLEQFAQNPAKILAIAEALRGNTTEIQAAIDAGDQDPNTPAPPPAP